MTAKAAEVASLLARLVELLADDRQVVESAPSDADSKAARRTMPDRVLLTAEEAANRLGVGRTTMYGLIGTGEIQSVQIGRLRRISVDEIDAYAARLISRSAAA